MLPELRAHKPELLAALEGLVHPPLSDASQAELAGLVRAFTARLGFSKQDADEALQVALDHPENALMFYRGKVKQLRIQ